MNRLLADRSVSDDEALHKVKLQRAFDLGYDDLHDLTRTTWSGLVEDLIDRAAQQPQASPRRDVILRDLMALDAVTALTPEQLRRFWGDVATDSPGRDISPETKREVWRRDGGRCVRCGTQAQLEFDHIVPYSLGGSNTARNVQLLCQACNRAKGSSI